MMIPKSQFTDISKKNCDTDYISEWKSKGLSNELIKPPDAHKSSIAPAFNYVGTKTKQNYIYSWENSKYIHFLWDKFFWFCFPLFGAVKLSRNANIDKYK